LKVWTIVINSKITVSFVFFVHCW